MKRTMTARIFRIGILLGLAVYVLTILAPVMLPGGGTAYASGEQYVLNFDTSQKAALNSCLHNHNCTRDANGSDINNMALFVKNGVYQNSPIQLNYEPNVYTPLLKSDEFAFTGNYNCQNFSISLLMTIDMGSLDQDAYPSRVFIDRVTNNDTGDSTNGIDYSDSRGGANDVPLSYGEITQGAPGHSSSALPPSCLPAGLNAPSSNDFAGSNTVSVKNFTKLSSSEQHAWGAAVANPTYAGNNGGGSVNDSSPECSPKLSTPLTWLICPVVFILVTAINAVDSIITNQLTIPTDSIFCNTNNTCRAYYTAWQSFRNIALGLMAIAGLAIVIAQALGLEALDAYTIRKALPRLLIAILGVTLSWPLMKFLLILSNDLGYGVRDLIQQPFHQLNPGLDLSFGGGFLNKFLGGAVAGGAVVAAVPVWIVAGGIGALIAWLGTAALAVAVAFLVLVLRQIVVVMLMLLAPIAIIAYVLPNTQRLYRVWWESFIRALLMFPMIAGLIAVGRVFSAVALNSTSGGSAVSVVDGFIGFAAYFAPYFMIPLTFRLAGGAMSGVGNFVSSRAQGGFSGLSDVRKRHRAERVKAAQTGGLYRNEFGKFKLRPGGKQRSLGGTNGILNTIGNYSVDIGDTGQQKLGNIPGPGKWVFGRSARLLENQIAEQTLEHSQKGFQALKPHYQTGRAMAGLNHYFLDEKDMRDPDGKLNQKGRAMQAALVHDFGVEGSGTYDEDGNWTGQYRAIEGEKDANALGDILQNGGQGARQAAAELHAKSAMIGSFRGAGKEETQRADLETIGLMAAAQAGRVENEEISASREGYIAAQGRDLGGYATTRENLLRDIGEQKRVEQSRGHGTAYELNKDGQLVSTSVYARPTSAEAKKSWRRISAQALGSGKSEAVGALRETMIADASLFKVKEEKDRVTGATKVVYDLDKKGRKQLKRGDDLTYAKEAQDRIKYIASYAVGDSGVGVEIQQVADRLGMGQLGFGGGGGGRRLPLDAQGMQPAAPPDPNAPGAPGTSGPP